MDLEAIKNIYDGYGSNMKMLVPIGMKGKVIDNYVWGPHRYIVVEFENAQQMEFGDSDHPLISYKRYIKPL
jgi:hypothetical protein